ncbi:hypothetical protein Trydic_g19112 [Trypoxylus dichotomus]
MQADDIQSLGGVGKRVRSPDRKPDSESEQSGLLAADGPAFLLEYASDGCELFGARRFGIGCQYRERSEEGHEENGLQTSVPKRGVDDLAKETGDDGVLDARSDIRLQNSMSTLATTKTYLLLKQIGSRS